MPIFWLALFLATPFWLIGGLTMAWFFPSVHGKIAALWTVLPLLALWTVRWRPKVSLGVLAIMVLSLLGLLAVYPYPKASSSAGSSPSFPSILDRICNFVPERDLSELGVSLASTGRDRDHVLGLLRPLYAEMAADSSYSRLPHVVGSTARDVFLDGPGSPHYFCYVPPGATKPRGAIVFYHGALGSFTVYLHFWKRWAEKRGWIVVCPSDGFGRWYTPDGEKRAVEIFDRALAELPIDPSRVIVAGMSNGGTAVTQLTNHRPGSLAAMLLMCPVLETEQTTTPAFLKWTQEHPAIVIEGDADVNVPPDSVLPNVEAIVKARGRCDVRLLKGHDHYVMMSAAADVYRAADELADSLEGSGSDQTVDLLPEAGLGTKQRGDHLGRKLKAR